MASCNTLVGGDRVGIIQVCGSVCLRLLPGPGGLYQLRPLPPLHGALQVTGGTSLLTRVSEPSCIEAAPGIFFLEPSAGS